MPDYLQGLRMSIDDRKRQAGILKPSAQAAREKQYGMTDGGGKTQTAAKTTAQKAAVVKPSAQAVREKQYGMTDSGGGIVSTAVQPTTARTEQATVIKPSAIAAQEQQYGIVDWKNTKPQTVVKPEAAALVSARPEEKPEKQNWAKTVLDVADRGAGYGVQGLTTAIDVAANALPIVEGWVFGVDKDATFTGQVLRPVTYLTGKFDDWVRATNANTQARIENDTRDSKVAQVAADIGSGVVGALPSAVMAILSGGSSAAAQLGTQATGISGTVVNAANTMLHNPVVQYNFAASLGNEFNAAKASGASDMDAMTAATVSGLFNAIVESGGVEALPKQLRGTDLSTGQKALKWMFSTFSEGSEEPIQGLISEMTAKATYDYDKPYFSTTDENAVVNPGRMVREFGYGTAVGGILSGVPFASRKAMELWERSTRENIVQKPRVSMADFTNPQSSVFRNLAYDDTVTQLEIMQQTHQDMVKNGSVVIIPESTLTQVESYYPDLRSMKKQERTPILKQKITELKTDLREFLSGLRGVNFEFEVNGNILDARLYDTGIREVMEKVTQDKASMIRHSDDIFRKAQYLYSTPDYDGDPNVYRWNYFYTPVQIGKEMVGVRIAVRDINQGNLNKPESQIYNWGIKKDAVLGGGRPGETPNTTDASSSASSGTTLGGGRPGKNASSSHASSVASNDSIDVPFQVVNVDEGTYAEYIGQLWEAQEKEQMEAAELWQKVEELRQEYLRNMARLEEEEREAELEAAFLEGWNSMDE